MERNRYFVSKRLIPNIPFFIILTSVTFAQQTTSLSKVAVLKCEGRLDPIGIDHANPHFEWQLQSDKRGTIQSAYQIRVASKKELLTTGKPDLWDSGQINSRQSHYISYNGKELQPSQKYYWSVRLWDNHGNVTDWSKTAMFVTGLPSDDNWKAKWITAERTDKDPLPIFRKEIELSKSVKQAYVHICGLGQYELRMNGQRIGDHEMDPGWTNYRKTCLYSSYDVTNILNQGDNCIAVLLGNGMYNVPGGERYTKFRGTFGPLKLICRLNITFTDGSTRTIISNNKWKFSPGPVIFTCVFGGEDYDARLEQPDWDKPGFDDDSWKAVKVCDGPGGKLVAQYAPPVKVDKYLSAVKTERLDDGRIEVDCGLNLSARPVIKVKGPAGSRFTMMVAERQGVPWTKRGGYIHTYILKGEGEETFRPKFTYFSFQYMYISGIDLPSDVTEQGDNPILLEAGSEFLTSSAEDVGGFECSNTLLNDIDAMIDRSVRSNLHCILTDCPHREKLGWLETSHLMGPSILYHRDAHYLYRKICQDINEAQMDNGFVPNIAPAYTTFKGAFFDSPEWGSACVQLPNLLYKWYGDNIIRKQYESMKRYTQYLADSRNEQGLAKPGLGDWYDWTEERGHIGNSQLTPKELPGTAFLYDDARIVAQVAKKIGRDDDAAEFEKLSQQVRQDFIKAYYKPEEYSVATGSQASLATALHFGLVPEQDRQNVLDRLVKELEQNGYRQSTGEVCFRMLIQALAEGGRHDVIYRMINRTDKPGYGNMLKLGYKTLSERLDSPGSSMNHCMFGQIQEWFQNSIVGIRQTQDSVGFEHIKLCPEPVGDLRWASGHFDSMYGRIESNWRIEDGSFKWQITVPANTTAEVYVPTIDKDKVTESDNATDQAESVEFLRFEPAISKTTFAHAVYEIGSGNYRFSSKIK